MQNELLRKLPKVDDLLLHEKLQAYYEPLSRQTVVDVVRIQLEDIRTELKKDVKSLNLTENQQMQDFIMSRITAALEQKLKTKLKRVINATGTILHTNLGRALLPERVKAHIIEIADHYNNLEYVIEDGKRGSRHDHVDQLLTSLTGTEAAMVVNNNAAAVMLILNEVAKEKEVIVSRGELVEVGGSFRIPEIMEQSGAVLKEVGSTNKTHLRDYEDAIHPEKTGALLKVHTSNYRIMGFTEEVSLNQMVALGAKNSIPVIHDLGSGCLINLKQYGIYDEPTIPESVSSGADLICFSGDKLLGGPQAGIIIGKKVWIDRMKKNPLTRAFRVDKLTLAALEATLQLYYSEERAMAEIPTLRMMTMSKEETRRKAEDLLNMIGMPEKITAELEEDVSQIGGGSLPGYEIPGWVIKLQPKEMSVNELETTLRLGSIPVIARIKKEALLLDVRTVDEEDFSYLADVIQRI